MFIISLSKKNVKENLILYRLFYKSKQNGGEKSYRYELASQAL